MSKEIEAFLLNSEVAMENATQVKDISTRLAEVGYDAKKIEEGKQLHQEASTLHQTQQKEYGEQYEATNEVKKTKKDFHKAYIRQVKISRIALEADLSAQTGLGLNGKRKQSLSGYLSQAALFYSNILKNDKWKNAVAQHGVSTEKLEEGGKKIQMIKDLYEKQKKETGEAQKATEKRDEVLDKFDAWYSKFKKFARIALDDDPQLLEMLGIIHPSDD